MKAILSYFKNRINLWLLPLLMTTAAGSVIIECYMSQGKRLYTAGFFVYALLTFMLLDLLIRRKVIGGIVYTVLLLFITFYSMSMVFTAEYRQAAPVTFQQWFYASFDDTVVAPRAYSLALFFGGGFFMNSVIYYFTQVRYRALGSLLILFLPFVIYAKRQDIMDDLTITVLITLYLAVMVHNRIFLSDDSGKGTRLSVAYVLSVALFVSVAGAISMVIPDMSSPSKLEQDADMFNFGNRVNAGDRIQNTNRSTNMHGVQYTGEPIMYVYPENMAEVSFPMYLRRRSMNVYDPSAFEWYAASTLDPVGVSQSVRTDVFALYNAEKYEGENGRLRAPASAFKDDLEEKSFDVEIEFAVSQGVNFVPAPLYTTVALNNDDVSVGYAYSDMFYLNDYIRGTDLGRISEHIIDVKEAQQSVAEKAGSTFKDFYMDGAMAADTDKSLSVEDPADRFSFFMKNLFEIYYKKVNENYRYNPEYMNERGLKDYDRIKALADEIVRDCESDYEKIKAIEGYFEKEGFVYNADYVPSDESLSYFLFESREGICIDFASAMTVMLIMENIPCRYVEGYLAYEIDPEDPTRLVVRDANAHAFVEAFVPYVGWMGFEPTVPGFVREITPEQTDDDNNSILTVIMLYIGRVLIVLAVLFVLIFVLLFDRIWEFFFRIKLHFGTPEQKLLKLYKHISALLEYEDKADLSPYTADLLNGYILQKTGSELREVTDLFEKNRFGNREITEAEFLSAYARYKELLPLLRKKAKESSARV